MLRVIYGEFMKMKRNPVWLAFLIMPVIPAIMGTFNYRANLDILQSEWYSLWSQHTLFFCYFFMPALIGVYCSLLWKMEHFGHNWNQLMVAVSPYRIIMGKLIMASFMTVLTLLWIYVLFVFSGRMVGLSQELPRELPEWILCGIAGGMVICSVQIFLSLLIRSFAVPIGIALAGGIVGLMATSKGCWYLVPYASLSLGMRANNPQMEIDKGMFLLTDVIYFVVFCFLSVMYLKKADVKTG